VSGVEPLNFDGYVDVLRQRLFDYEGVHGTSHAPDFAALMSDHAYAPEGWPVQAYEELIAQRHLNPKVSAMTLGSHAHGLLSADGRYYVRQQQQERLAPGA
jgi:hypothetical protein